MNRRLILLLGLFGFVVFIIVLSSAVFSLKTTELNFLSTTHQLNDNESILNSAQFEYGQSIFFINRDSYIENLEQNNPYLKVVSLEVVFPNKLIVHAVERNEMYAFKLSNNTYAITDDELKVLAIKPTFVNSTDNAVQVFLYNENIPLANAVLGQTIVLNGANIELLKSFSKNSREWENNLANLRANIKQITLNYEQANTLNIEMRQGVHIIIVKANEFLSDKLQMGYSVYDSNEIDRTTGIILIIKQQNEEIVAMYDSGE